LASEKEANDSDAEKREARSESFKYDQFSQFSKTFLAKNPSFDIKRTSVGFEMPKEKIENIQNKLKKNYHDSKFCFKRISIDLK